MSYLVQPSGEARWARCALGALVLGALAAADAGLSAVLAVPIAALTAHIAAGCRQTLDKLAEAHPPAKTSKGRRMRNLRSLADFMRQWMTFLSHLAAAAVCARALSQTADHVTGGRSRRWLFGYEARALGEPWPDVLGVTIMLVMCAMFMCGLENSPTFTIMLIVNIVGAVAFLLVMALFNIDKSKLSDQEILPRGWFGLVGTAASMAYAYPSRFPRGAAGGSRRLLDAFACICIPTLCLSAVALALSLIIGYREISDTALPMLTAFEVLNIAWARPIMASFTVVTLSLAMTDICPGLFKFLVRIASPEWRVITRSLTYESSTTGSPVLAVFTAGSLSAILAFACPLSHLISLMNAGPIVVIIIQAITVMILRCQPTEDQKEQADVQYKRLGQGKITKSQSTNTAKGSKLKSGLWFLPPALRQVKSVDDLLSKKVPSEERECLLLDEYAIDTVEPATGGSSREPQHIDSDAEPSDAEPSPAESSDGDSSTDIDAAVKEYTDRVKVVTSIPLSAGACSVASSQGARRASVGAAGALLGAGLAAAGLAASVQGLFWGGIVMIVLGGALCAMSPPRCSMRAAVEPPVALLLGALLLVPLLPRAGLPIVLFAGAGCFLYVRWSYWCGGERRYASRRVRLRPTTLAAAAVPLTHVDTIYLTR